MAATLSGGQPGVTTLPQIEGERERGREEEGKRKREKKRSEREREERPGGLFLFRRDTPASWACRLWEWVTQIL